MALFLSSKLRRSSNTSLIEDRKNKLWYGYKEFTAFEESKELQDFRDLEKVINSENFKKSRKQIEAKKFKGSELYKREKELAKILKSKAYRIYLSVKGSTDLSQFEKTNESETFREFIQLETDINSGKINKKEDKESYLLYNKLQKSSEIKTYFKFKNSKKFRIYNEVLHSNLLEEIENLKNEQASEKFVSEKKYLLDKKRFEQSDAFKSLMMYKELNESDSFVNYFKLKKKNDFHLVKEWEITFSEDFTADELDKEKWLTRYYWGDALLNDAYALPEDSHIFSDKNIKISNSIARLETRKEKAEGKIWDAKYGFRPIEFNYTSALISTGKSFRQKYGLFEAKIKVSDIKNVNHSFWMLSDTSLPHIDILKTNNCGKVFPGSISGNEENPIVNYAKIKGLDWTNDFFIYSLEWTPNKLIWKINDVVVYTQTENIPQDPMYLILSSGVSNTNADVNAVMEIDWVKCYQKN